MSNLHLLAFLLAQSTVAPEIVQLARIKHDMSAALAKLPDYTCMETIERSARERNSSHFRATDSLRLGVAFIGGKEVYAWHGARRIDQSSQGALVASGVTSNGEFAAHARSVFSGGAARIQYAGTETLRGRAALRWNYSIPTLFSGWTLEFDRARARVGSTGSFWADASSLEILELDIDAAGIEPGFPISAAHIAISYGKVRLSSGVVLVPQSADLLLTGAGGSRNRNLAQFTQCRQYGSEAAISFASNDAPDEPSPNPIQEIRESRLPADLILELTLAEPIDSQTAVEGDEITALVDRDVKYQGKILVSKGALARGRIRRLEKYVTPKPYFAISFEFVEIEFDRQRIAFSAKLEQLGPVPGMSQSAPTARTITSTPGLIEFETLQPRELPGVGTFFMDGRRVRLERGLRSRWRTAL